MKPLDHRCNGESGVRHRKITKARAPPGFFVPKGSWDAREIEKGLGNKGWNAHLLEMITVSQIKNGSGYLSRHLSANDYYSEGETVEGIWLGKGAELLGLSGRVEAAQFEALRNNLHPGQAGLKLTPRRPKVAFHDVVLSAPKGFSIAAIVGKDERLMEAFCVSVETVLSEFEKHACVRRRDGDFSSTEAVTYTQNLIAARFIHDSSRLLTPQVHAHLVLANASFEKESDRWLALQPRQMLEASKESIRQFFYDDLSDRVQCLGYDVLKDGAGFRIQGISREMEELYSPRTSQKRDFIQRFSQLFGKEPGKDRIEAFIKEGKSAATARFKAEYDVHFGKVPSQVEISDFVKDWRSSKLRRITTAEVRTRQREQLTDDQRISLDRLVAKARVKREPVVERSGSEDAGEAHREGVDGARKDRKLKLKVPGDAPLANEVKVPRSDPKIANWKKRRQLSSIKKAARIARAFEGKPAAVIASSVRRTARGR